MKAAIMLRQFLKNNVPQNSPLRADNNFARHELNRMDLIEHAVPLNFFKPLMLVPIVYMDPGGGTPGYVLEDIRIVYDSKEVTFDFSSIKWINTYRKLHPLDMSTMAEPEIKEYINELVSLVPGADRWGFNVLELKQKARFSYMIKYEQPNDMIELEGALSGKEKIKFTPLGAIDSFPFLEEDRPLE